MVGIKVVSFPYFCFLCVFLLSPSNSPSIHNGQGLQPWVKYLVGEFVFIFVCVFIYFFLIIKFFHLFLC